MDHSTQVSLMRRIFRCVDERTTDLSDRAHLNPVASYTAGERWEREKQLLFREHPLLIGLSGDLAQPGQYLSHHETGLPILAARLPSGDLRAFVGVCRHRGAPLVEASGRGTGRFTCPYHGWSYDHAGALAAQPGSEWFADVAAQDFCLRQLPIAEQHGMIFVRPTALQPIDVDQLLGGAQAELSPLGLEHYVPFARHESTQAMNWKLIIDTFLEAYHVPVLHQRTLGPHILAAPAAWDAFGRGGRMIAVRRSLLAQRDGAEADWNLLAHSVVLYLLFPNTMLIHQIDHIEIVQAYPGGTPGTARVVFSLYTPGPVAGEKAKRHFQRNFDILVRVSEDEDFRLGQAIQRGFEARALDHIVFGRNEPGLAHYHRSLDAVCTTG